MKKLLYLFTIFALLFTTISVGANNYATVFNPITGNRKVVKVGDPHAFDNGYLLEIANGYTTSDMLGYSVVSDYQTTLSSSMTTTQSTIAVSSMATTDGHTLTMSDLGSKVFLTIEPTSSSKKEIVMCTGISSSTWTGCTRGLAFYGTSTASVSANRKKHSAGSIIIISNVHYVYEQLVDKDTSETITGDKTYSGNIDFSVNLPTIPTATPTTSDQIASKQYVDDVGAGGFTSSNIGDGKTLRANGTSPETMDIATSTSEMASFDIENGYFVVSTSTGEKIDTHWNDRYNATTTKSGDFTFSDDVITDNDLTVNNDIFSNYTEITLTAGTNIAQYDAVSLWITRTNPTNDAKVSEGNADTNYGSDTTILIGQGGGGATDDNYGFFKWDLTSLPTNASKVVIRFYSTSGASSYALKRVTGADWNESTLTWNNKPTVSEILDTQNLGGSAYVDFDITELYNNWKGGANNYGVAFATDGGSQVEINSSENATNKPQLLVYSNKIMPADDDDVKSTDSFIGFAKESITANDSGKIQLIGKINNPSWSLITGLKYYISATAGEITTSTGLNSKVVGIAIPDENLATTTQSLLILNR